MEDKKISVGVKYKDIFDSIVDLAKQNALPNLDIKATKNEIHFKQKIFAYDDKITAINDNIDSSITAEGASWFGVFRNEIIDTSDSEWIDFVNEVSESYHKEYSFFELPEIGKKKKENEITNEKRILGAYSKVFFEHIYNDLRLVDVKSLSTDIFAVSLRLEINRGTGALQPLITKIYFERDDEGGLLPIVNSIADDLDKFLVSNFKSNGIKKIASSLEETEKLSNQVCAALDMLIAGKYHYSFAECVHISNPNDVEIMEEIIRRGSAGVLDISCTNVRILSITHTTWFNQVYYVGKDNTKLLEFKFGLNNKLSLRCINCKDDAIIHNNIIHCVDDSGEEFDILIDRDKPDAIQYIGLTKEQIQDAKNFGPFKKHLFMNSCNIDKRHIKCSRVLCSSQTLSFGKEKLCKTCPYPEKLYLNRKGIKVLTSQAEFDSDTLELVSKDSLKLCNVCSRYFSVSLNEKHLCSTCEMATKYETLSDIKKYKKLYSKYAGVVPLHTRMLAGKNKFAFEDNEIVIIVAGKRRYLINKTGITDRGYIKSNIVKRID